MGCSFKKDKVLLYVLDSYSESAFFTSSLPTHSVNYTVALVGAPSQMEIYTEIVGQLLKTLIMKESPNDNKISCDKFHSFFLHELPEPIYTFNFKPQTAFMSSILLGVEQMFFEVWI